MSISPGSSQESWSYSSDNSRNYLLLDQAGTRLLELPSHPFLSLSVAPETRFRYRYDTEMSGTHGSLQAERCGREKNIPTVVLHNYPHSAIVRVSLFTCNDDGPKYPHPHQLFVKEKLYLRRYVNIDGKVPYRTGHYVDPHYIVMNNQTAKFEGMCIISTKKEQFSNVIRAKLIQRGHRDNDNLDQTVDLALREVDNAFVCLCFEAFTFDRDVIGERICPPLYSKPIANAKNASTGKLKITRINKCSGSCKGGDSIWLLVEKINKKGLVVRFFETAPDGSVIWEADVAGDKLELHHQYAVIFNTPPYREQDINRDVTVNMRLERRAVPFDYSDSESFVYEPCKQNYMRNDNIYRKESLFSHGAPNKRPISDLFTPCSVPNKRRVDESMLPATIFAPINEGDLCKINEILKELYESQLGSQYDEYGSSKEDWQYFIPGTHLETDGVEDSTERTFAMLRLLLKAAVARTQLTDGDLRAVTEQISRLFLRPDDIRLQDAASTLLSMRSRVTSKKSVHEAMASGDSETLLAALKSGADAGATDKAGRTPLHVAVEAGLSSCVQLLLKEESKKDWIDAKNKQGLTALHIAIRKRNLPIVKLLISSGANANITEPTSDRTPLIMALKIGDPDLVRCVAAAPNIVLSCLDEDGRTAAELAAGNERLSSIFVKHECAMDTLNAIARILNQSDKWKMLADLCDAAQQVPLAEKSTNPSKYILNYLQEEKGMDLKTLRDLLDALDEREAVSLADDALATSVLITS